MLKSTLHLYLKTWLSVALIVGTNYSSISFAQSILASPSSTQITLISGSETENTITFQPGNITQIPVATPKGNEVTIAVDQGTPVLKAGYPDLPKLTTSVIIPDDKSMQVTVLNSAYTDYENISVAPSKGSITRDVDPATILYTYAAAYHENKFFPENIATLRDPYILRDFRGQTAVIYPVQYNPVTKTLRVYSSITIKISPSGITRSVNVLHRLKPLDVVETDFSRIYQDHFLNYKTNMRSALPERHFGSMLIISYGPFLHTMQPFVQWKKQEGIPTEIIDVATIGNNAASIKNFIANYYVTHPLMYLLLVGDAAQVPASRTKAGDSDNDYGYLDGDDHYQEIFVGRFSAQTQQQLVTQIQRTLLYEKNPLQDPYYSTGIGIASNDYNIGDDGEHDWQHERNIRTELLGYTYSNVYELYDGSQGGEDAPGNPSPSDLSSIINKGAGLINYTGHGSNINVATTMFDTTDVNALTNESQWPFLWVVGCVTGNFVPGTCFAESWARVSHDGQPTGAVASFMSAVNQYWSEPMEAQDEFNNLLTNEDPNMQAHTFGGISVNGCFSMNDKYGPTGYDMTDTWIVFGDPSLTVRTEEPTHMSISHDSVAYVGDGAFSISCDQEEAYVSVLLNDQLIGSAEINGGHAEITFPSLLHTDSLLLTVTAFNKMPCIKRIPVRFSAGPKVIGISAVINDAQGNNNGIAEPGEIVSVDLTLKNVGLSVAQDVTASVSSPFPNVTIMDENQSFGTINDTASVTKTLAFSFKVDDHITDGEEAYFLMNISDSDEDRWNWGFFIPLSAPSLKIDSYSINDVIYGNGNDQLDPGDTADIIFYTTNAGHGFAENAIAALTDNNPAITVLNSSFRIGTIENGETTEAIFKVAVLSSSQLIGIPVIFTAAVNAENYGAINNFSITIAPQIESFETNTLTQFPWITQGDLPWYITPEDPYQGAYCLQSGKISENESSDISISFHVLHDDSISFFKRVNSEPNYDSLKFFIDDHLMGGWSGNVPWSYSRFPISSGDHIFKWSYAKNEFASEGEDAAWLDEIDFPASELPTGIGNIQTSLSSFEIYPNPFSTTTVIKYHLEKSGHTTIQMRDAFGRTVELLRSNQPQSPGDYQLVFDGSRLPAGIYFCELQSGTQSQIRKLIVVK